jgi:hypothetical protein
MDITTILLYMVGTYLILGFIFTVPFLAKGIMKIDESAKNASIGFRIIIIPGVIVFWIFLLRKWIKANNKKQPE